MTPAAAIIILAISSSADGDVPSFVLELAKEYERSPPADEPEFIYRYKFRGKTVYYVAPLYCCDLPGIIYTESGEVLCRPDGGIAGTGDGTCMEFHREKTSGKLIWEHPKGEDGG